MVGKKSYKRLETERVEWVLFWVRRVIRFGRCLGPPRNDLPWLLEWFEVNFGVFVYLV